MNWQKLRKKYPKFIYHHFEWKIIFGKMKITFDFEIESLTRFKPEIFIERISEKEIKKLDKNLIDNLVFNLGMIESLSYWKATCSPKIELRAKCCLLYTSDAADE